ncbi:MAG: M20/M25/M40 family metallo-hydrolase [Bacteroidia bacterium]|nr:MAG: M20/M25/M40 family metallo-hydrolase [Bacteroidia bacterium]
MMMHTENHLYLLFLALMILGNPGLSVASDPVNSHLDRDPARLLSEYVQIPSVSGSEKEAGEFLMQFCLEHGLHVRVFTDDPDSYNFAASLYPLEMGKPNIVLMTHIDVVPAGDPEGWTYPPFSGTIADGMVWGRGAIDNKALGVMQVLALLQFVDMAAEEDLPYNVSLLAVSGEETGGDMGARIITNRFLDELNPAVVYGEGGAGITGLVSTRPETPVFGVGVAQKRRMFLAIESTVASSGHGSIPRERYPTKEVVKATAALLDATPTITISPTVREGLLALSKYETGIRQRIMRRIDFYGPLFGSFIRNDPLIASMLTNTISLTSLSSAEGAYNQIPTHARAVFDCRLLPETDENRFLDHIRRIVAPYDVTIEVIQSSPAAPVSEQGHYYRAMEESIHSVFDDAIVVPFMFVAINDNRFFRRKGIPAYGLLPAIMPEELMESIHYFDERFPIDALHKGIDVYVSLIDYLLNNPDYKKN